MKKTVENICEDIKDAVVNEEITLNVIDDVIPPTYDDDEEIYDHEEKFSFGELFSMSHKIEEMVEGIINEEVRWYYEGKNLTEDEQKWLVDTVVGRLEGSYHQDICDYLNEDEYKYR